MNNFFANESVAPLVSIITPTYNSGKFILEAYNSILSQTYTNWEWVVTDDCSSDDTFMILSSLSDQDDRVKVYKSESNQGAGSARNISIKHASGRYIAFLDSDDLWLPNKLEKQVCFMSDNDLALSYTWYRKFTHYSGDLGEIRAPKTITYKQLLKTNVIGCLTAIYDTEKVGKCYMPLIRKRQDFGLWLFILKKTDRVAGLPEVLAKYRVDTGMTQNKVEVLKWQWKFYREVVGLSVVSSCYYFCHYAINGFLKYKK